MKTTYSDESGREIEIRISVDADCLGGGDWSPGLRVFLDEAGFARVEATSWHSSDNGTLMTVWHGRDHQWTHRLPQGSSVVADMDKLVALAEELAPLLIRVREGLSVGWDGSNMRGTLDEDASEAAAEVSALMDEEAWVSDTWTVWDAAEWIWAIRDEVLTAETTDEEIEALAAEWENLADRDHVMLRGDVPDVLRRWRDEMIEKEAA